MTSTTSDLPVIPARREAHCPLAPPAEFADWRKESGLQRAMWNGQQVWSVSRYQDIRAALVDPRLSAETLPDLFECVQRQHGAGDFRAHRRSRASSVAAHDDQPIHLPTHRGDAAADPGTGRQLPGRDDRQRAARRHRARLRPTGAVDGDRAAAGRPTRRSRTLPAQHLRRIGREVHRRGTGAGLHRDVCVHPGVGRA